MRWPLSDGQRMNVEIKICHCHPSQNMLVYISEPILLCGEGGRCTCEIAREIRSTDSEGRMNIECLCLLRILCQRDLYHPGDECCKWEHTARIMFQCRTLLLEFLKLKIITGVE